MTLSKLLSPSLPVPIWKMGQHLSFRAAEAVTVAQERAEDGSQPAAVYGQYSGVVGGCSPSVHAPPAPGSLSDLVLVRLKPRDASEAR